jgi:hypothetical protein
VIEESRVKRMERFAANILANEKAGGSPKTSTATRYEEETEKAITKERAMPAWKAALFLTPVNDEDIAEQQDAPVLCRVVAMLGAQSSVYCICTVSSLSVSLAMSCPSRACLAISSWFVAFPCLGVLSKCSSDEIFVCFRLAICRQQLTMRIM